MRTIIVVIHLLLCACTSTDPRQSAGYYDGYDDGEEHAEECMK